MAETLQQVQRYLKIESSTTLFTIDIRVTNDAQANNGGRYYVDVARSVERILMTRLGARVMRPQFGSALYLLRDRTFNSYWKAMATRYMFEAIARWEPRVRFKQLHFNIDPLGRHDFYLELERRDN